MKKVILIDGNNLLFRSYYATAYKGNILRNSKGFPTNALYGFINMLAKIIHEENPSYMMVAFDVGKTFRHEKYESYKDGRKEMPLELKQQFPVAKKITEAMGIKYFEMEGYEADDIIGTFAKEVDKNDDFVATIVSSDRDLLQLISSDVEVKLLKTNDSIRMNEKTFREYYGIEPIRIIDLKALMGDASDNIPGVKGIGEKTALNLLHEFKTLDEVYNNLDNIGGKTKERLLNDKENAYFSKELATIYKDVPIDVSLDNIPYLGYQKEFVELLKEYEFYSILKKMDLKEIEEDIKFSIVSSLKEVEMDEDCALYLEVDGNYHDQNIIGMGVYSASKAYFVLKDGIYDETFYHKNHKYTYDLKKLITLLKYKNISYDTNFDDLMIVSYLLNYSLKDDIAFLMNSTGEDGKPIASLLKEKKSIEEIAKETVKKAKYIYQAYDKFEAELEKENQSKLYKTIELPLTYVLADMEYTGVNVDSNVLAKMRDDIKKRLDVLTEEIYRLSGETFNILSPKQLGKVLFEDLKIPYPKRSKGNSYSTSSDILNKLMDYPIIPVILEYRTLAKLYSNYAVGLMDVIKKDGKIHTIFTQTLTRTGRLSSVNPNLQNIPVREEYGRLIRKAFIPSADACLLSSDYSQIELRVFAHMSEASNLIDAFNQDMDIHTKTAMDIFHVSMGEVTPLMRRNAKAVNFGILYGISSFGLSEDLGINVKEAKEFIDHYLKTYPGIRTYMDSLISDAKANGYVKTLFGRKRVIDEFKSSNFMVKQQGERIALNTPIQGTSADLLKIAMIRLYNELNKRNLKSKILIQVHDELVIDCKKDEIEVVTNLVREIMEKVATLKVPLKVDIHIGNNWYEAK